MPYIEVEPNYEQQPDNPFAAIIGTDSSDFELGTMRIEPPVAQIGQELLEEAGNDVLVELSLRATDANATLLRYIVIENLDSEILYGTNQDRIIFATKELLGELGHVASKETFINYWNSFY